MKTKLISHIHRMALAIFLFLIPLGLVQPASAQASSGTISIDPQEAEAFFDGAMSTAMDSAHVPGAVVVVVKDGEVLLSKGYGYADLEKRIPVNPATTLFRPGSVSKLFTWTAVMQLVEQGKLSLDEDVNTYLDFQIPPAFGQPITLRHLMTHTPGFEDRVTNLFKLVPEDLVPLDVYLKGSVPQRVYAPGTVGAYSNYGTALAGYIVERTSGKPFAVYIEEEIFSPLGMDHATFRQPLPADLSADMAGGYNFTGTGYLQGPFEYISGSPAGGLSASGLDMAHFMIAHLQNGTYEGRSILKAETAEQMHSPLYSADPHLNGMACGFFYTHLNGQYIISHGGDTVLFHSGLYLDPEQNLGLFISTNSTGGSKVISQVSKAFFNHYFPVTHEPAVSTADYASRAALYNGTYISARNNFSTFEKIFALFRPVWISMNKNGLVTISGIESRFVETEPGVLEDVNNPASRLVLQQLNGQVMLVPGAPMVFLRIPWYADPSFQLALLTIISLFFLESIFQWTVSFFRSLRRHEKHPLVWHLARLGMILFGLSFLAFLAAVLAAFLDINPTLNMPNAIFRVTPALSLALAIPYMSGLLWLAILVLTVFAWIKRYWTVKARIHYSLLTLAGTGILWMMIYWNFLL